MYLITGGGSGIGQALAHELAKQGKEVLIVGRRREALLKAADFSPLITTCCADITQERGRQEILSHLEAIPQIDGVIHNAGVVEPIMPIAQLSEQAWNETLATNLTAPLLLTQLLLNKLTSGRVLHIGSGAAYFPVSGWAAYCVSKAGLSMLTRCWQLESHTTAFASVMPGIIDTDMQAVIRHSQFMDDEKQDFFKRLKQENRLIQAETVAIFLSWLLLVVKKTDYISKEWDIYDTGHHSSWLIEPHVVPPLEP